MSMFSGYHEKFQRTVTATKALNDTAVEYISGIEVIKAFGQSKTSYAKFVSAAKEGADCFIDWMQDSLFGQAAGMAILPSTLLGILPVGCLLSMHGTLSAETFLAVIVLSFGVMQPLITAFSYTDDIAQVKTIARLIASLWDVKDGAIELGGVDIHTLPLAKCTKRIAYVSQDNYLFDLSVMDNIRMGKKGATDEEVIDAAKKCGCHAFIMGLENGYQTVCGASGGHLSGSERQRISIARAVLKDAPIVILDEATSYTEPGKRGGHSVGTGKAGTGQDAAGHRPPPVYHRRCRSDHRRESRQDRSRRHTGGAACLLPALSNHVGSPHQRQRRREAVSCSRH